MEQRLNKLGFIRVTTFIVILYYNIRGKEVKSTDTKISTAVRLHLGKLTKEYYSKVKYIQTNKNSNYVVIKLGDTYYRKLLTT